MDTVFLLSVGVCVVYLFCCICGGIVWGGLGLFYVVVLLWVFVCGLCIICVY